MAGIHVYGVSAIIRLPVTDNVASDYGGIKSLRIQSRAHEHVGVCHTAPIRSMAWTDNGHTSTAGSLPTSACPTPATALLRERLSRLRSLPYLPPEPLRDRLHRSGRHVLRWRLCEQVTCEVVQWRIEDGGNGNWYRTIEEMMDWDVAAAHADGVNAHLASVTSEAENVFIANSLPSCPSPNMASGSAGSA